jgi:hypothetical protein
MGMDMVVPIDDPSVYVDVKREERTPAKKAEVTKRIKRWHEVIDGYFTHAKKGQKKPAKDYLNLVGKLVKDWSPEGNIRENASFSDLAKKHKTKINRVFGRRGVMSDDDRTRLVSDMLSNELTGVFSDVTVRSFITKTDVDLRKSILEMLKLRAMGGLVLDRAKTVYLEKAFSRNNPKHTQSLVHDLKKTVGNYPFGDMHQSEMAKLHESDHPHNTKAHRGIFRAIHLRKIGPLGEAELDKNPQHRQALTKLAEAPHDTHHKVLYRGAAIHPEHLSKLTSGTKFHAGDYAGFTQRSTVAKQFATNHSQLYGGRHKTLFHLHEPKRSTDISGIGHFKEQAEHLVGGGFQVQKVHKDEDGFHHVHLSHLSIGEKPPHYSELEKALENGWLDKETDNVLKEHFQISHRIHKQNIVKNL